MALARFFVRWRLLASLALAATACTSEKREVRSGAHASDPSFEHRRAGGDVVMVVLPATNRVRPVWDSLRGELDESFDVATVRIFDDSGPEVIERAVARTSPRCVVLLDNKTTSLYARYQAQVGQGRYPPAVILLTSFVDMYSEVKNAVGIAYEVPVVISASNLRALISRPVERVGVVHRRLFARHVAQQAQLASVEKLAIVGRSVKDDATPRELAAAVADLLGSEKVDALWILNDNALLTPEHITVGWLPLLAKDPLPTIVGIPSLVTSEVPFGTFAVVPDLGALGVQAANVVYELAANDFVLESGRIEQPVSVETVLDIERARADFGFKEEMRNEVGAGAR